MKKIIRWNLEIMNKIHPTFVFSFFIIISLVLHLLIVLRIYYPGNMISMPLTGGMLLAWLFASRAVKDMLDSHKSLNLKSLLADLPSWWRYLLLFFTSYGIINFISTLSPESGNGWVDLNLGHDKLRGISGFWVLFYALGFSAAYLKEK